LIKKDKVYFCVSEGRVSRESVKFCLNEMEFVNILDIDKANGLLKSILEISNDNKVENVRFEIQETESQMKDTIISIIDRGTKLDEINKISDNLLLDSKDLFNRSKFIRREIIKKRICSASLCVLGSGILVGLILILVS
jgi:hypothetical protein